MYSEDKYLLYTYIYVFIKFFESITDNIYNQTLGVFHIISFDSFISLGPRTNLSDDQEWRLVNWLLTMSKIGYGISRMEIPFIVKDLIDKAEKD